MEKFDDIGINISFKGRFLLHIQRELELFSIFGEDFFSLVSKFICLVLDLIMMVTMYI